MITKTFWIAIAASAVLASAACERIAGTERYVPLADVNGEIPAGDSITRFDLDLVKGKIWVVGKKTGTVRVEAKMQVAEGHKPETVGTFADYFRLEQKGETIELSAKEFSGLDPDDMRIDLVVHIPARLAANIAITAGNLKVEDVAGPVKIDSEAGRVQVLGSTLAAISADLAAGSFELSADRVDGEVSAKVEAGNIEVRIAEVPPNHNITLHTATGKVLLDVTSDTIGSFKAVADLGQVTIVDHEGITAKRTGLGARAEGSIDEDSPVFDLSAKVGNVEVR